MLTGLLQKRKYQLFLILFRLVPDLSVILVITSADCSAYLQSLGLTMFLETCLSRMPPKSNNVQLYLPLWW